MKIKLIGTITTSAEEKTKTFSFPLGFGCSFKILPRNTV